MSNLVSCCWCIPGVQNYIRLPKPYVVNNKSNPFTKVDEHLTSLISLSQCMCTNIVSILFFSLHNIPVSHYYGVRHTFSILFMNIFSIILYSSSTSSLSYSDIRMVHLHFKIFTCSAFDLRALVLSLHAVFLTTHFTILIRGNIAIFLSALSRVDNTPHNHHFLFHRVPSTALR